MKCSTNMGYGYFFLSQQLLQDKVPQGCYKGFFPHAFTMGCAIMHPDSSSICRGLTVARHCSDLENARAFPRGSDGKQSACNRSGRSPGEGDGNPVQYSCHEQRNLAGCSPWGRKESDMTKQISAARLYKKYNNQGRIKLVFITLKYTGFQIT